MITVYRNLLRLYPAAYRREFGAEMTAIFSDLESEAATQRFSAYFEFMVREAAGLLGGVVQAHWRQFLMRRFTMRGDFRFPKTTWVLMTMTLALVLWAIAKGEAISVSVAPMAEPVGVIHPASAVMSSWTISFLLMYVIGIAVGGALFLLRRSAANGREVGASPR